MTIKTDDIRTDIFHFAEGKTVEEFHVMVQVENPALSYEQQLEMLQKTYDQIKGSHLKDARQVFKRYYLSDAANQSNSLYEWENDCADCAISVVQQPPLNGTKIALWAYLLTDVQTRANESGLFEVRHGAYRHLWNGSAHNLAANSEYQTRLLFNEYIMQLAAEGCTLRDNCVRTWFFVNDIDLNYGGVVRARNQVFFTQGLTRDTHFIASTGIGGRGADQNVLSQMDNYAVSGLTPGQMWFLYAPTHLNRTSDYGVSFERGTSVDYGDRRHVFISGTASINNKGEVVHTGDIVKQTERMLENVEVLLREADCSFADVGQMSVYLRDTADYHVVNRIFAERFPDTPYVIVYAPVCRPGWLIEMECMAVKAIDGNTFEVF